MNQQRVKLRPSLLAELRHWLQSFNSQELGEHFERVGLPYAPISRPEELFDDEHLLATGGLADITLPDGPRAGEVRKAALFPFTFGGHRLGVRLNPPIRGEHTDAILLDIGFASTDIEEFRNLKAVA